MIIADRIHSGLQFQMIAQGIGIPALSDQKTIPLQTFKTYCDLFFGIAGPEYLCRDLPNNIFFLQVVFVQCSLVTVSNFQIPVIHQDQVEGIIDDIRKDLVLG